MRPLLLFCLSIFALTAEAQVIPADVFIDMETGVAGQTLTAPLLASATHVSCTGGWQLTPNPLTTFKVADGDIGQLPFPVTVAGVQYPSAGTRVFDYDHSGNSKETANCRFTTYRAKVSAGMFLQIGPSGTWAAYDYLQTPGYKTVCIVQLKDNPTTPMIWAHTTKASGASYAGQSIPVQANVPYWVTSLYDSVAGLCSVAVFDPVTWTQIGVTSTAPIDVGTPARSVLIGLNGHGVLTPTHSFIDDLLIDWTAAAFPLGVQ